MGAAAAGAQTPGAAPAPRLEPLLGDHITPTGPRTPWLADADFGVVYNRREFVGQEPDLDLDGIPDATDNCLHERNSGQEDDGEIGDPDIEALRNWLARAPIATPALQRCSVAGGIECDVRDFAVLTRARNGLAPAIAQVCAAASPL